MIKTINRIRLPEVNSGTYPRIVGDAIRIFSKFFVDRKGVLRSPKKKQPSLHIRWQCDSITGKLVAHGESGDEPGLHLHSFRYSFAKRVSLQFDNIE